MKSRFSNTWRAWLLTGLLLAAQGLVLQHEVQIDAHAGNASCEWCLAHAPLTGTTPPELPTVANLSAVDAPVAHRRIVVFPALFTVYASRAPPRSSSV